ncbi:hypothetical protein J1N35_014307 [Gossypium stocksii]|uniref:Secreted protein n=1 Tax=Gossypium stocksii TaxID=47602 RepID=A0A9D4A9L5_9ROSI|nr:hypothetical protein J1N35_014307 [Gossypium stocksii]
MTRAILVIALWTSSCTHCVGSRISPTTPPILLCHTKQLWNCSSSGSLSKIQPAQGVDLSVPSMLQAWLYILDSELAHVLLGCIREPPLYFYHICNLCPRNWTIISSSLANSLITDARSSPHSKSEGMDISSLLRGTQGQGKAIVALLSNLTTRKKAISTKGT